MDKDLYRENRPIDFQPTKKDVMAAYLRLSGYTLRSVTKIMGYDSVDEAYQKIKKFLVHLSTRKGAHYGT